MDLSQMSATELRELQQQIVLEVKRRERDKLAQAREQIRAIAERVGVPVKELLSGLARVKSEAGAKSLRHPSNMTLQWSGRGRQPKWVKEWLASGRQLEELRS